MPLGARTVPSDPSTVRSVRRWPAALLADRPVRVQEVTDDAVLLLSETVTNAVRYGAGPTVTISVVLRPDAVHVEVTNRAGATLPHFVRDTDAEHGRGLPILDALARAWGYRRILQGHLSVWFEVETKAGPAV